MGAIKEIYTELLELDCDTYSLSNRDDVFDLVVDAQLQGRKLSPLLMQAIRFYMVQDSYTNGPLAALWLNDEFRAAMEWHASA